MKIWIDGYEANVEQRLGSGQVAFELLRNLEKIDHHNDYTILLPSPPLRDLPKAREGWNYKILQPKKFWTRIALPFALYTTKIKPDVFFSPTHYIPRFSPVKRVVTIFDLSFLHFPGMFLKKDFWQLTNWTKFSAKFADHIITISKFSKKDIIQQYKTDKNKITVAYPGFDKELFKLVKDKQEIINVLRKYKVEGQYILYIGTIQPRKNLARLIEAVGRIENLKLIVVGKTKGEGKEGWMYGDILQLPKKIGIEDRVKFCGFIPKEDLPYLLSGSLAFIQPSLWEGFGIPVVEAMATATPVIISDVSSLPEVVGKAGLLVDPNSVDQIEQAIRTIITDKKLRTKYSKAALKRSKIFSWAKMARVVLSVLESI